MEKRAVMKRGLAFVLAAAVLASSSQIYAAEVIPQEESEITETDFATEAAETETAWTEVESTERQTETQSTQETVMSELETVPETEETEPIETKIQEETESIEKEKVQRSEGGIIAQFSFDDEESGFHGGGARANRNGSGITTTADAVSGNALYLSGKASWLDIVGDDGKNILSGKDTVTISYFSRPDKQNTNWSIFAAPNENTQVWGQENYLGVLDNPGSMRVERYKAGRFPTVEQNTKAGEWKHVAIVVEEDKTTLYINGEAAEADSSVKLSEILGEDGIFQIGKGNWESGEFYKGCIDEFTVYDKALTAEEIQDTILETVKNGLITQTQQIKGNINLPLAHCGADVSWTSSEPSVISDREEANSGYDPTPAGVVTRGAGEQQVKLTAAISLGGKTETAEYDVTVAAKAAEKELEAYLFSYFPSNEEEQIYFAAGEDELHFEDLNNGHPVLTSDVGDLGVRDPYILRSAEGDHFYMIATDLKVQTTGWGDAQQSGSLNLVVWESDDLVNWSEPRLADVGMTAHEGIGCVWAPEAIYDEKTGEYIVFWASMQLPAWRQVVYYSKTRDFISFTEAVPYIDRGDSHCIDTSIIKAGDKYYRVSADGEITLEESDSILGSWSVLTTLKQLSGGMNGFAEFSQEQGLELTGGIVEGPELFKINKEDTWGLYVDNYGGVGYIPITTTDLSDTTGSAWQIYTENQYDFGYMLKRHGTILGITREEYESVTAKWGDGGSEEEESHNPILEYNFEDDLGSREITDTADGNQTAENAILHGSAEVIYDEARGSHVLSLDGGSGGFAELPQGFFDNRDTLTISMDVKSDLSSGNFFTFTYGKDSNYYNFLRIRGKSVRNALTVTGWKAEKEVLTSDGAATGEWQNVKIVIDGVNMKLYVNGSLVSENKDTGIKTSRLGTDLLSYLGKSFYSDDGYFKGAFDDFKVYNRALSAEEIIGDFLDEVTLLRKVTVGTVPEDPQNTAGTDTHTAVTTWIDKDSQSISSYVRKGAELRKMPVDLSFIIEGAQIEIEGQSDYVNGGALDLREDVSLKISYQGKEEVWTLKVPSIAYNPVLSGQYADPDIDYFDGKYWIYPTTDGYSGWGGTVFHAFSSEDLREWKDEGVILDVNKDNPGVNENGIEIASSAWSDGNAWAPSIEKKNGKYYFYYCGRINDQNTSAYTTGSNGDKAIGVAVADHPEGPYVAQDAPILYPKQVTEAGIGFSGQVIDPSIFTDDDGKSYILFGNGTAAIAELSQDMTSIVPGTMQKIEGLNDFREGVIVTKVNGTYHFTWSCDDTGSPDYHVNYGTANSLHGNVTFHSTLLQKDEEGDMLGTAHHSVVYMPETGKCYIAYHRFYTPLGIYTDGLGYHRETCVDEITFNADGYMKTVKPTMEGVLAEKAPEYVTVSYTVGTGGKIEGTGSQKVIKGGTTQEVRAVASNGYVFSKWSDSKTAAARTDKAEKNITYQAVFTKKAETDAPQTEAPPRESENKVAENTNTGNQIQSKETVKVGMTYTIGNYKYKVTSVKNLKVTVTGVKKKTLKTITVKNTVKIKGKTFKITAIGNSAFKNCRKVTKVTIGKNVTAIGKKAFYKCAKIKTITIKSTKLKKVGKKAFSGISSKAKIKVPKKKVKSYKKILKNKGQKSSVTITK